MTDNLFDAIARLLDPKQREYFYQRMLYFRHLRADDELLRIVEAIGFLALLIREAPHAVAIEREHLSQLLTANHASFEQTAKATRAHTKAVEDRLKTLPADVAAGIHPSAIARAITESLRQEFVRSGLPATAEALAALAKQLDQTTAAFQRAASELADAHRGAAVQAMRALDMLNSSVRQTTQTARQTMTAFRDAFRVDYWCSMGTLVPAALVVGILLGFWLNRWMFMSQPLAAPIAAPTMETTRPPVEAPPSPSSPPAPQKRPSRGRGVVTDGPVEHGWNALGTGRGSRRGTGVD